MVARARHVRFKETDDDVCRTDDCPTPVPTPDHTVFRCDGGCCLRTASACTADLRTGEACRARRNPATGRRGAGTGGDAGTGRRCRPGRHAGTGRCREASSPGGGKPAEPALGSHLIGKLEGPTVVTDAAQMPKAFKEAPMLAELVKAGKLPPVEQRLPAEPLVVKPVHEIGKYGGTWRRAFTGQGGCGERQPDRLGQTS